MSQSPDVIRADKAIAPPSHQAAGKTRGNPLAAGLLAFGAGMLASSLIPASGLEQKAAAALKDRAEPITSELGQAAKQLAEDMREPVQAALETVKESASDSMEAVKDEGAGAAGDLKDRFREAGSTVRDNGTTA